MKLGKDRTDAVGVEARAVLERLRSELDLPQLGSMLLRGTSVGRLGAALLLDAEGTVLEHLWTSEDDGYDVLAEAWQRWELGRVTAAVDDDGLRLLTVDVGDDRAFPTI